MVVLKETGYFTCVYQIIYQIIFTIYDEDYYFQKAEQVVQVN